MGLDMWLYHDGEVVVQWRKMNALHRWFQTNGNPKFTRPLHTYEGVDSILQKIEEFQGPWSVSVRKLKDLKKALYKTKRAYEAGDKLECEKLLPTQGGFFWGDTAYNEYYYEEVKRTLKELESYLVRFRNYDDEELELEEFEYVSWW